MTTEMEEKFEAEFVSLVKKSWQIHRVYSWNDSVDELLIGAMINASLEKGYLLIDLSSEPVYQNSSLNEPTVSSSGGLFGPINSHAMRFEKPIDKSRLIFELERITSDLSETKVLGQLARITIGYGEKSDNFNTVLQVMKQEFKSSFVDTSEPGIITFDAETVSGYIYAKVAIIVNLQDYNKSKTPGDIDYDKLNYHVESVVHSLKKYLKGRKVV